MIRAKDVPKRETTVSLLLGEIGSVERLCNVSTGLSKNESKDCALFVAANEADAAIVEAHDLAGETQTDT